MQKKKQNYFGYGQAEYLSPIGCFFSVFLAAFAWILRTLIFDLVVCIWTPVAFIPVIFILVPVMPPTDKWSNISTSTPKFCFFLWKSSEIHRFVCRIIANLGAEKAEMVDTTSIQCNHRVRTNLYRLGGLSIGDSAQHNFEVPVVILSEVYGVSAQRSHGRCILSFSSMVSIFSFFITV